MNNELTIDQMNEAIALFMGGHSIRERGGKRYVYYPKACARDVAELKYHSSWDKLMPVVENISSLDNGKYNFHISSTGQWACYINRDDVFESEIANYGGFEPIIINVWKSVFKFIQWYNKQQSQ